MNKNLLPLICLLSSFFCQIQAQVITATDSMSVPRANQQSQKLANGSVLTFGGENGNSLDPNNTYASAEIYSGGVWTATGSMLCPRTQFASVLLPNGKVMAIGGIASDETEEWASCEIYDPATGRWTYTDSLRNPIALNYAVVMANGKVLEADGDSSFIYDPATGHWSPGVPMAIHHGNNITMVALPTGKVLAAGGLDCLTCADVYDPIANTWTQTTNNLFYPHVQPAAILLNNGKVLVAGSSSIDSGQTASELYDTAANRFTNSGTLLSNVSSSPAVLLDNGDPLIWSTGDAFGAPDSSDIVQIYNVATGNWFSIPTTGLGTSNNTLVKLSNNVILVVGGFAFGAGPIQYCELINGNDLTGIKEISQLQGFSISPNPGVDYFNFVMPNQNPTHLGIYDLQGKLQLETKQNGSHPVNTTALAAGTYLILLYDENNQPIGVQKWVKL